MPNTPSKDEASWKNIVFISSFVLWGGGTVYSVLLSFRSLDPWRSISIAIISVITTVIYVCFSARKKSPSGWKIDCSQAFIPNLISLLLAIVIIFNCFVAFHVEEFLRKHYFDRELEYSGIEASIDVNINDSEANKAFKEKTTIIAEGKRIDKNFLIGCWFTLKPPEKSSKGCYTKAIEIRIKKNKYGKIWDLIYPVYLLNDDFQAESENIPPYDIGGTLKLGYKLNITCIRLGQESKFLLLLQKKEDSVLPFKTWKYAISLRFRDK